MPAIALLTEPGSLVGFLLLANPVAISQTPNQSDCLLAGIPSAPVLLAHPLGAFIQSKKHTEFVCKITRTGGVTEIRGQLFSGEKIQLEISAHGNGKWSVKQQTGIQTGYCELAKQ